MANTLVGLFDDRSAAEGAVQDLVSAGVSRDSISIVANDASGNVQTQDVDGNLAAEGASAGVSSGAVVGGVAGLLIGLGFTVLPIAGFLLAGPVAGLIAGAATGAVTGGVVGGLIGLGIPQEHAELYAEGVRRGGTLVTVSSTTVDEGRIRDILDRDGAVDIEERHNDWKTQGYTGYSATPLTSDTTGSGTTINNDWTDTASATAPSVDDTYARTNVANENYTGSGADNLSGSTYGTTGNRVRSFSNGSAYGTSTSYNDADWDSRFRSHFTSTNPTGNYEEYAPAYDYGRQIGSNASYADDFDTNDTYRTQWESRNPGTWDKFKSAVRHAIDEVRGKDTANTNTNRANLY